MAEGRTYRCDHCPKSVNAWSDGHPYYVENGKKRYAHHPDHDALARCTGNEEPHLCLACGKGFKVDSSAPITECPHCLSGEIATTWNLEGRRCPRCRTGHFRLDAEAGAIS